MLTYQLQQRLCRIKNEKDFVFPNDVEIEIFYEPTEQFGVMSDPPKLSKTAVKNSKVNHYWDANTGKHGNVSDPPLQTIQAVLKLDELQLEITGNILKAKTRCQSFEELSDLLTILHYFLPILLNLELAEPPVVKTTRGRVGESIFGFELESAGHLIDVITKENQEKRIIDSFHRITLVTELSNRRLAAACYYYYVAKRLVESGNSPYEFLAEVVLNLCKVLQALFGERYDDVRAELKKFDYSEEDIEKIFIPLMVLRNEFDVGHVSIKLFNREQLNALYTFLENIDTVFKVLLKKVMDKVAKGEYILKQDPDLLVKGKKLRTMKRLIENWETLIIKKYFKKL